MRRRLFDRRVVMLDGTLDDARATAVGAALMTLDASGDEAIDLRIDCADGTTEAALSLMDVIDLLGVPVRAWCTGQVAGASVGVLAVCDHRTLSPHGRVHLVQPRAEFEGSAGRLGQLAEAHAHQWGGFCRRLAGASGQPAERVAEDTARGLYLTASEAVAYGLADEIARPDAGTQGAPRPRAE
jgi:ATP-dependent Clp protease protease subunit